MRVLYDGPPDRIPTILRDLTQLRSQDFGGDGRSDILGRGQAGSAPVWHVDGAAVLPTSTAVAAPGAYWALA